jgi:hypothetical protein
MRPPETRNPTTGADGRADIASGFRGFWQTTTIQRTGEGRMADARHITQRTPARSQVAAGLYFTED